MKHFDWWDEEEVYIPPKKRSLKKYNFDKSNRGSCDGKKVFLTWKQAQTYHNHITGRGSPLLAKGKKLEKLHAYRCNSCGKFHVGHSPRKKPY